MKSVAQFRLIDFILAMTVYLQIRHSHFTRAVFPVLVLCSRELVVSGDSIMKKVWGGHCGAKEKEGGQHKFLSCMAIFHFLKIKLL